MTISPPSPLPLPPVHVAIIMDGNRRWAREKGKHILAGHQYVADVILEQLVERAADRGVKYITFWAWSTENWKRTKDEVKGVMRLFEHVLAKNIERLHKKGVRIQTIGDIDAFPKAIATGIRAGIEKTKNNQRITVILALNYGGRDEIIRAINKVFLSHPERSEGSLARASSSDKLRDSSPPKADQNDQIVTKEEFAKFLDTKEFPDPDLIIRTGGDKRLSGFLLWQSEYSELYFTDTLMPDFTPEKLDAALADFVKRKRRFGK